MSAAHLLNSAKAKGIMIATAESCTGGMVSAALTDIAGSSAVFDRAFVTYTNAAKQELLGVKLATLAAYGAVSEQIAAEMADGALRYSNAQVTVAITGIAGPGGSDHKPEGRVCFGVATQDRTITETVEFGPRGRDQVRQAATDHALALLQAAVDSYTPEN